MSQIDLALRDQSVEVIFRESVSAELARSIVGVVRDASRLATSESAARYSKDQAREARPWIRRAALGSSLLTLETAFPSVKVTSNRSSGSTFYIQLEVSHVTILVARARDRVTPLPPASYRTAIALKSIQYSLFAAAPLAPDARVYSVILYGGSHDNGDPEFIVARFPTGDHKGYLDTVIDLKAENAELFAPNAQIEHIVEQQNLMLKEIPSTGTGQNA